LMLALPPARLVTERTVGPLRPDSGLSEFGLSPKWIR
jgi:hypothetical protein